jgi:alanine-glyoxylate transaminase/serine-glyoxylate transaminase/serine-pyruvate transaminase
MTVTFPELNPPVRILMGPGPSDTHPRVLAALARTTVGHLDPYYLEVMNGLQAMLRAAFRTTNPMTFAVSGTGSAGMEAAVVNLVEPGDRMVVCVNGVFGGRMTSTGAWQPMEAIARVVREAGALLLVDAVTALGGIPVEVDAWQVDAIYAGTQKCLSCPPGLAPISFSPRAMEVILSRKTPVQSWYLDVSLLANYWGQSRAYHHTAPINMTYALYEALRLLHEEGLENAWARHRANHLALKAGLEALGIRYATAPGHTLPQLNAVLVPPGVDDAAIRSGLLTRFGIEIGAGLGAYKGKVWRIGLMGYGARPANVLLLLAALEQLLEEQGYALARGSSIAAANAVYAARQG